MAPSQGWALNVAVMKEVGSVLNSKLHVPGFFLQGQVIVLYLTYN